MAEWMRNELIDAIYEEYLDVREDMIKEAETKLDVATWNNFSFVEYLKLLAEDSYVQHLLSGCLKEGCKNPTLGGTIHALCEEHYNEWASAYFKS